MPNGYMGKLLNADLSSGTLRDEALPEALVRAYLGGYGLGARLLYDRMPAGADALGPEAVLGFLTGPLTGTNALIGSRFVVVGKSPKTGTWGDANCGGQWGPYLKFAGYDGVLVSGIADRPVYILIEDGKASIQDASEVWGKKTAEAEGLLKRKHGDKAQVALIGPAGEKLSLLACVMNEEGRAAGRSALGAVMGSKRLKAIVVAGNQTVPVADDARVREIRRQAITDCKEPFLDTLKKYGTAGITADGAASGDSPVKNWGGSGQFDFGAAHADRVSDDAVVAHQERKYGCYRCPIACGGIMKQGQGKFALALSHGHKPEYETLAAFGSMPLNDNVEAIIKANELCNEYGMDTISAGCTVSFAIECFENEVISVRDTGGLELRWGNAEAMVELTRQLGAREGFGATLADGMKIAAQKLGPEATTYAIHVAGEEVPMHDPRFLPDLASTYLLDATPGRHTQGGALVAPPDMKFTYDKYDYASPVHAQAHRAYVNITHVMNSAGVCMFGVSTFGYKVLLDELRAVTGWNEMTEADWLRMGERIGVMRHAFNLREGHNPLARNIPGRLVGHPPLTAGPLKGVSLDYVVQVRAYLKEVDWDPQTTVPSASALRALELADLIPDLQRAAIPAVETF